MKYKFPKILLIVLTLIILPIGVTHSTFHHQDPFTITILGVNDFHGQITTGRRLDNRPVGGAAVLASYLRKEQQGNEKNTLFAFMGDAFGASPPASGLLKHEPTVLFLNSFANHSCLPTDRMNPNCNMVATAGNHEFDRGKKALLETIKGTDKKTTDNWIDLPHYPGASFPYVSANIVDEATGGTIFPPYVIKNINGVKVAFIGAILKDAPAVIIPASVVGLKFLDEAESINRYIPEVKAQGATVIVALMHQGGYQLPYEGATQQNVVVQGDPFLDVVKRLDDSVDVVLGGHTHQFMNAMLTNQHGKSMLVVEANCYSAAFAKVKLTIDPNTHAVINKTAQVIKTFADAGPGLIPDANAEKLVGLAESTTESITQEKISILDNDLLKMGNEAGESNLGNLVADAYRDAFPTDIGIVNPGGLRADLYQGQVLYGNLYAVQPFGNFMVKMALTGQEIYDVLEQQWTPTNTIILQISGITYSYDLTKPIGQRIVKVFFNTQPLVRDKVYSVATNNFLASGGDGFALMQKGRILEEGITDLEALVKYVKSLPKPFTIQEESRINKLL